MNTSYQNPVIPGFYPDPSICRAGNDFYLVTSTFQYFPGVPVFHSTDLVNWKQIGHCLTRDSQLKLHKVESSAGIYAPTIRYHEGKFYMVTTNTSYDGNFYVYTDDPSGEWSEPIFVDQAGIDPSLFFDDDGKVYFCSNGSNESDEEGIFLCEIDINTGSKLTKTEFIWHGSGGRYPEAPHLYRVNGIYYLMIAEGGTEYGHMVTIARSKSPWGPYEGCPNNPILTHRNRSGHVIEGTGHADIVMDHNGKYWIVFLGFRAVRGSFHHLGRETFLAPLEWDEDGWPIVNVSGTVELKMYVDREVPEQNLFLNEKDDFDSPHINLYWNFLRVPYKGSWSLTERKSYLRLYGLPITLKDVDSPAFLGRRQQHFECKARTKLEFYPQYEGEEAGLTVLMDENHHYDVAVMGDSTGRKIIVRIKIGLLQDIVAEESVGDGQIILEIKAKEERYYLGYGTDVSNITYIAEGETRYLSSEVAGGYTGVYFGIYATGNGKRCSIPADFDWFEYDCRKKKN